MWVAATVMDKRALWSESMTTTVYDRNRNDGTVCVCVWWDDLSCWGKGQRSSVNKSIQIFHNSSDSSSVFLTCTLSLSVFPPVWLSPSLPRSRPFFLKHKAVKFSHLFFSRFNAFALSLLSLFFHLPLTLWLPLCYFSSALFSSFFFILVPFHFLLHSSVRCTI